jgi:hypothetical protein
MPADGRYRQDHFTHGDLLPASGEHCSPVHDHWPLSGHAPGHCSPLVRRDPRRRPAPPRPAPPAAPGRSSFSPPTAAAARPVARLACSGRRERDALGGRRLRRECVLNQLGHHTPARHEVHHTVGVDADEPHTRGDTSAAQPVHDHHGTLVQGGLHGRRPRGRDDDIRGGEHASVRASTVATRTVGRPPTRAARTAPSIEARRARDDELHARVVPPRPGGRFDERRAESVAARSAGYPAAARRRRGGIESQRGRNVSRGSTSDDEIDERMAHELDRHAGSLVDRRSKGKMTSTRSTNRCKVRNRPGRQAHSCGLM